MRADFVDAVKDLAIKTVNREWKAVPGEPPGRLYRENAAGDVEYLQLERAWQKHVFHDIRGFVDFIRREKIGPPATIFVNSEKVNLLFDHQKTNFDSATMPLTLTEPFRELSAIKSKKMTQQEFVKLLRVKLADSLQKQPEILQAIRTLKWRESAESEGNLQHGNESMAKSLKRELAGADAIPDTVVISVDVFEQHPIAKAVRCALTIDLDEKVIMLEPLANELEKAKRDSLLEISVLMQVGEEGAGPPVYLGSAS